MDSNCKIEFNYLVLTSFAMSTFELTETQLRNLVSCSLKQASQKLKTSQSEVEYNETIKRKHHKPQHTSGSEGDMELTEHQIKSATVSVLKMYLDSKKVNYSPKDSKQKLIDIALKTAGYKF